MYRHNAGPTECGVIYDQSGPAGRRYIICIDDSYNTIERRGEQRISSIPFSLKKKLSLCELLLFFHSLPSIKFMFIFKQIFKGENVETYAVLGTRWR